MFDLDKISNKIIEGNFEYIDYFNKEVDRQGLAATPLLDSLIKQGEPNYLEKHIDKAGLVLKGSIDSFNKLIDETAVHYSAVLQTPIRIYNDPETKDVFLDIKRFSENDLPYVGVCKDYSLLVSKGEKVYCFAEIASIHTKDIALPNPYLSLVADPHNVSNIKDQLLSDLSIFEKYGEEDIKEQLVSDKFPFSRYINKNDINKIDLTQFSL